ncbi:hypothetical protein ZIOFF_017986 [Zingiber officinale]|uniref:FRIGIDA interacting protein 1 n=1 Tax=Zingiber officinale TaxID=94328 RepID=A0A8J5HPN6_ZINOF|nr:hypothetical protein ZIOFF_017986 [Zingiber officinale]
MKLHSLVIESLEASLVVLYIVSCWQAGFAVVAAATPWIFLVVPKSIPTLLCSCNVLLLILTGMFQQYWVYQVRKVRLQGYYSFSQRLKHIARLPFATITYGKQSKKCTDATCLSLATIYQDIIHYSIAEVSSRIVVLVEVICAGCFMSVYVGYIHQYNSLDSQPDILRPLYSALQPSSSLEDMRYYDGGRLSDQQMALLQYQRENLHYLNEEVLRLQECVSKYQGSDDGNTPQVDLAHLLASRNQELRALTAEMNQVHSELRLARNLIAERDAEIQHMRVTNDQYIEENERLRAILGEWSTRAAKLERALEAEHLSNVELQKNITKLRSKPSGQWTDKHQS